MDQHEFSDSQSSRRKLDFDVEMVEDESSKIAKAPQIGMEFDSEDAAYQFYNEYAYSTGFSIRRASSHKDTHGQIIDRKFCCSCEGKRVEDKRDVNVRSQRPETRTCCRAMMKVSSRHRSKYEVVAFKAEHTGHGLVTPNKKSHMLRSHRRIDDEQAAQLDSIDKSGIQPKTGLNYLAEQAGGRQHVGFLVEDIRNHLRSKRTKQMEEGDAGGLLYYLQSKQSEDSNFFYAVHVDEDELIASVFWADGQMREDYGCFGDVVTFDTTYKINNEAKPLALFVGINHHMQSTVFGASLLYDETADTFMWLFDSFLKAMNGKKPLTILTDQDAAMAKALRAKWPETHHRLCIWHLYKNALKKLCYEFKRHRDFSKDFRSCIYDYEDEEDFIDAWDKLLNKYNLENNEWLATMFKNKEKWALVYGRQTFCGNMVSTQRSESMNAALKNYVDHKLNILRFFEQFGRLVDDRRYEEMKADLRTNHSTPKLPFEVEILKHAREVYTHAVFKLFQAQWSQAHDSKLEIVYESDGTSQYNVTPFEKKYHHSVTFEARESKISCSCKKFEFAGILCSHALKVFTMKNIMTIPDSYIQKRWTKKAKKGIVETLPQSHATFGEPSKNTKERNEKIRTGEHHRELGRLCSQLTTRSAPLEEAFQFARSQLIKIIEGVDTIWENKTLAKPVVEPLDNFGNTLDKDKRASDEVIVRGWKKKQNPKVKSGKRLKSALELGKGKPRKRKSSTNSLPSDGAFANDGSDLNNNMEVLCSGNPQTLPIPIVSSLSQISQNYGVDMSNMTSTHAQFGGAYVANGHAFSYIQPSQTTQLNTLRIPQQFNPWSQYVEQSQVFNPSLT